MRWLRSWLAALLLVVAPCVAQEQWAHLVLDDGEEVVGIVVAMDLQAVQVRIGEVVRTFRVARLRHCRFDVAAASATAVEPAADTQATAESAGVAPTRPGTPTPAAKDRITWKGPLPDPIDTEAPAPYDQRHRSLWRARIEALDEAYPWLVPTAPVQWCSLGLLLAILAVLGVHLSVRVAGAEAPPFGRSAALAAWYLVTGAVQVAALSTQHLNVVLMLLLNPVVALFWLRTLFALPRSAATVAFAVQVGLAALGWAVLELVNAILGSVAPAP
ncbi:MAG: hypothetical protein WAT39_06495 [Planctomycetota bacterium]